MMKDFVKGFNRFSAIIVVVFLGLLFMDMAIEFGVFVMGMMINQPMILIKNIVVIWFIMFGLYQAIVWYQQSPNQEESQQDGVQ